MLQSLKPDEIVSSSSEFGVAMAGSSEGIVVVVVVVVVVGVITAATVVVVNIVSGIGDDVLVF